MLETKTQLDAEIGFLVTFRKSGNVAFLSMTFTYSIPCSRSLKIFCDDHYKIYTHSQIILSTSSCFILHEVKATVSWDILPVLESCQYMLNLCSKIVLCLFGWDGWREREHICTISNIAPLSAESICSLPLLRVHGSKRTYLAPRIHGLFIT